MAETDEENRKVVWYGGDVFYVAVAISKDDLRMLFQNNKEALKKIDKLTDEEMSHFAMKYGEELMDVADWKSVAMEVFNGMFLD